MYEKAMQLRGRRVACWCVRYTYRGVLSEVHDDCLVLTDPFVVEISGGNMEAKVKTEDPIPGEVIVKLDAIEILYTPNWA